MVKCPYCEVDNANEELVVYLKENFAALKEHEFSMDGVARYQELQHYFTFMYR